jgi:undecaprenyl-diphosphatase
MAFGMAAEFWRRNTGVLVASAICGVLFLGFVAIASVVMEGTPTTFDQTIMHIAHDPNNPCRPLGPPWLAEAMRDITGLGSTVVITFATLAVFLYLWVAHNHAAAVYILSSVLGGWIVSNILKTAIERPRPVFGPCGGYAPTFSFPSGHTMMSAVVYLTIGALLTRLATRSVVKFYPLVIAVVLTGAIGVSRIYLGVHWPSDVLAGWCIGGAWAMLCWIIMLWLEQRRVVDGSVS